MSIYPDLEIDLYRRDAETYGVELRFSNPDDDADDRLEGKNGFPVTQIEGLRATEFDPDGYGKALNECLFGDAEVHDKFLQAATVAQAKNESLRVRLFVGLSAPELHRLRWETLRDPAGSALLIGEQILFSRYLSSANWRPVPLRPQGDLTAVVAVANPTDIASNQVAGQPLAPIDVPSTLARAQAALDGIAVTTLASGGDTPVTLNNLSARLRDGCDILYLVCHGALIGGEPLLWLEDEKGQIARVPGASLVTYLGELRQQPRLVVLASCQSAGSNGDDVLTALGPRLAAAGVPAVLAMQGDVTAQTEAQFMTVFFAELRRDGLVDRAASVARGAVRERPDAWMPLLFMRLRSGRLWYKPGFATDQDGFSKWPSLLSDIGNGHCTPILGPGVIEAVLGSTHDMARRWAQDYHFPLAFDDWEDLPQVAQYLAIDQSLRFPAEHLIAYVRSEIQRHYGDDLPAELRQPEASLDRLIEEVGARRQARSTMEPHQALAQLPFPIYITTNPDTLLLKALTAAGRTPKVELCPWNGYIEQIPSVYDDEPDYRPDPQRPLVYHLFGRIDQPDSLVLTEDDYFDYLIGITKNNDVIPPFVRRAWTDAALLFLGFKMDDWAFRVLFRSIMAAEGGRRKRYAHVGVQIDPEQSRFPEPERARRYLEKYFAGGEEYFSGAHISIYWGSVEDFITELYARWRQQAPSVQASAQAGVR